MYDGTDILQERLGPGTTNVTRTVHGPGIDQPLASIDAAGTVSYYLADHLGSIVQQTSASAAVTLTRQYDPYGVPLQGAATSGYAYTGREWDGETGLYFYRARYFDPSVGRFLSRDPSGFRGGVNLYAYVANAPTKFTDPSGRIAFAIPLVTGAIGGAAGFLGDIGAQMLANYMGGRSVTDIDWIEVGVATGTGAAAGALAPWTATTAVGAILSGGVANVTQTWITNTIEQKCTTTSEVLLSFGLGMFGGWIGGKFSETIVFEPNSLWNSSPWIANSMNTRATLTAQMGVGTLLRSWLSGLVSNLPPSVWHSQD